MKAYRQQNCKDWSFESGKTIVTTAFMRRKVTGQPTYMILFVIINAAKFRRIFRRWPLLPSALIGLPIYHHLHATFQLTIAHCCTVFPWLLATRQLSSWMQWYILRARWHWAPYRFVWRSWYSTSITETASSRYPNGLVSSYLTISLVSYALRLVRPSPTASSTFRRRARQVQI